MTKPMDQTNQFITPKEEVWVDKLFQELGSELDFGESNFDSQSDGKKHPLEWTNEIVGYIFKLLLVTLFVTVIDTSVRNLDSTGALKSLPLCGYFAYGIDDYDNVQCSSYAEISGLLTSQKETLERELGVNLAILIPKKTQVQNVLNMPEVQFIQQKTGNTRISITQALTDFVALKNTATSYKGEDISCIKFSFDEKGNLGVNCEFYGYGINGGNSSRTTALAFLSKIDQSDRFRLVDQPKSLDIERYSSPDLGIRSTFTTRTTISLKLRYSIPNKRT